MDDITAIGIVILFGVILGHLATRLKIPSIAGYVIAGLIIGPSGFDIIPAENLESWNDILVLALAFLAFSVGTELFIKYIKKIGHGLLTITISEVLFTCLVVTVFMYLASFPLEVAFILGSLAASTSPAPILMIKKQYNLKNSFVENALAITALDDAIGIILFGVAFSVVTTVNDATQQLTLLGILLPSIKELALSVVGGLAIGTILAFTINLLTRNINTERTKKFYLEVTLVAVLATLSFAIYFEASEILTPLVGGFAFTNFVNKDVFELETKVVDLFAIPFLIFFFTVAGIQIDLSSIFGIVGIAILYIIARTIGKYFGTYFGAKISKHSDSFNNNMGFLLLPLGGVEIGLVLMAYKVLPPEYGDMVKVIVLMGTLVFSTIAPALAGTVLLKLEKKK